MKRPSVSEVPRLDKEDLQSFGIIIVTFGNEDNIKNLIKSIISEKKYGDKLVIIDNHPNHGCAKIADKIQGVDIVIRSMNIGFAAGCNVAANKVIDNVDSILLINPDIVPRTGAISRLRKFSGRKYDAWMGTVLLPNGKINSAGNTVHVSGLSWCGEFNKSVRTIAKRRTIDFASGACLVVSSEAWVKLSGLAEEYFMYYDDTDFSMRMHHFGLRIGIVTDAYFKHDYAYNKGAHKWFYIERNRLIFIFEQWPAFILLISLPMFLAVEVGLLVVSIYEGRFLLRVRSIFSFVRMVPGLVYKRFYIQRNSKLSNLMFFKYLDSNLSSPLLGRFTSSKLVNGVFGIYYRLTYVILEFIDSI